MIKIAICGGIGSGKSAVTKMLREKGVKVVVADEVNANLLLDCDYLSALRQEFPAAFSCNKLNKKFLADIVYSNEVEREKLMRLAHPYIYSRMLDEANGCNLVFFEIPLMSKCNLNFDAIWYIDAATDERVERIIKRDNVTRDRAMTIISLQKDELLMKDRADVIICNKGALDALRDNVFNEYAKILEKYKM